MKSLFLLITFLSLFITFSQSNTEVFIFDLNNESEVFELSNFKNISNNDGYDNQPSFIDNNTILYSGTRNGQTDIVKYKINYDSKIYINHTDGSEYSPLKIPNKKAVSAIRLEKDGTQKLYKYNLSNGESEVIIDDIIIGYHVWFNENILVSSVLEDGKLALYSSSSNENKNHKYHSNIGRSLHKIPNTNLVSFISKSDNSLWEIHSLNPLNGETKAIMGTFPNTEDMCWLPDGSILMAFESTLYTFKPGVDVDWIEVGSVKKYDIENITRLAVSPDGKKLAIVGELKHMKEPINGPLAPLLKNVAWIAGNWKGEAFGGQTEENWSMPSGNSMMAAFKLIKDGEVIFYELEIIREVDNTLILQLKHFNNDLKGWESKDDTIDFPLKEITKNKVVFEGMTFERINEKEMNIYVDIHQKDGSLETVKFNYIKE